MGKPLPFLTRAEYNAIGVERAHEQLKDIGNPIERYKFLYETSLEHLLTLKFRLCRLGLWTSESELLFHQMRQRLSQMCALAAGVSNAQKEKNV